MGTRLLFGFIIQFFKENKTTDASSANIYSVNNAAVKEDTTLSSLVSRLVSSTFVKNTG